MLGGVALLVAACGSDSDDSAENDNEPAPGASADGTATAAHGAASPTASAGAPKKLGTSSGVTTTARDATFTALAGAKAHFGKLDRSAYQVEIPDNWNGELVLYAHGFAGFGTEVSVQMPPGALRRYMISNGFAWAASSYGENGYVPGIGADDTLALRSYFAEQFGAPKRTYIAGASMGGNVVALALENHADAYDGGLTICGAMMGIGQIDYLASWVAVARVHLRPGFPHRGAGREHRVTDPAGSARTRRARESRPKRASASLPSSRTSRAASGHSSARASWTSTP